MTPFVNCLYPMKRRYWLLRAKILWGVKKTLQAQSSIRVKYAIKMWVVTLISLFAILTLHILAPLSIENNVTFLTAIGATIATMLALILSLSIIAVQKSSEMWSPAIARLYKRDGKIHCCYIVVSILAMLTFFIIEIKTSFDFNPSVCGLLFLAITLDLLRWNYMYISGLLDPEIAVQRMENFSKKTINKYIKYVNIAGKHHYGTLSLEDAKKNTLEEVELAFYQHHSPYPNYINRCLEELTEIACKSIKRREVTLSKASINSIFKIAKFYLELRKNSFLVSISPKFFISYESGIDVFLNPLYESLMKISKTAISNKDESSIIGVSHAYAEISQLIVNLSLFAAPLAYRPIFYLNECLKMAQKNGVDNAIFCSASLLTKAAKKIPTQMPCGEFFEKIIDILQELSIYFIKKDLQLVNELNGILMDFIFHNFKLQRKDFPLLLEYTLTRIFCLESVIFDENLMQELPGQDKSLWFNVYSPFSETGISHLFYSDVLKLREANSEKAFDYSTYFRISEVVYDHLHKLVKICNLSENIFSIEVMLAIKDIVSNATYLSSGVLLGRNVELIKLIKRYLFVLSEMFEGKKNINFSLAKNACEVIEYLGIQLGNSSLLSKEIIKECVLNLKSIINAYCKLTFSLVSSELASLLMIVYHFKILSIQKDLPLVEDIDSLTVNNDYGVDKNIWGEVMQKLERYKESLDG